MALNATEYQWITGFLEVRAPGQQPGSWVSSLSAAARDARAATGRDVSTGTVANSDMSGNWLGTLGYLVLLDQLGGCFEPRVIARKPAHAASFAAAVTHFVPTTPDREVLALYALRCAFAHDFALTNVGKPALTHRFIVEADSTSPLIEFPLVPWSGLHGDRRGSNQTRVNLRRVGDLAEAAICEVQVLHSRHALAVRLPGGVQELLDRFTLQLRP